MREGGLPLTASQTVGPFFHGCLLRLDARRTVLATAGVPGARIKLAGRVLDGDGAGVSDAVVEIWQADAEGRYCHPADRWPERIDGAGQTFLGFGRCATTDDGSFAFETIKPGAVPLGADRRQASHVNVAVFARGLLNHLFTRVYLPDDPMIADDPILAHVPPGRRSTLVARCEDARAVEPVYQFDIVLQGPGETVFFNLMPG